jgi:cysteine desulfuration protein SufE
MTLNELIEEFEFLGDWEDRCDFLIDLGFDLPKLPAEAKVESNRVHGCQSNVWLVAELNERCHDREWPHCRAHDDLQREDS